MTDSVVRFEQAALWMLWGAMALAATLTLTVVMSRVVLAVQAARLRRADSRYGPLIRRALAGDGAALRALVESPRRDRLRIGSLLIAPLVADRDPLRITRARVVAQAISLGDLARRLIESRWWWRRVAALRAVGLLQARNGTAAVVASLEDPNPNVRDAALDSLADLQDPAALPAIVVHLHDPSLQRGRRAAALAAFGSQCEAFLLDLSLVDPTHRLNYARALAICGTAKSRSTLCEWTADSRPDVQAASLEALAHTGLDEPSAAAAIEALESSDVLVRAMAAGALSGWTGTGDAAAHLLPHLDDAWPVAVRAARSLQAMGPAGLPPLTRRAAGQDLGGTLARQMLWEIEVHL
jgi:HEAT repeat protein